MAIHATALIDKHAEIDSSAEIGPYCIVGPHVRIGPQTRLLSHVVIENHTTIGARNQIHPFARLGGPPQDLKFKGEPARLVVGDDNVIREGVTLNIGTQGGHMETKIGNNCLLMAYSHVAHDCIVGNRVILANSVGLAGHVELADSVIMGGISAIHQFCRVGRNAFIAGGAMVAQDIPPFCIAQGDRAQLMGLNITGIKRAGWSREKINLLRDGFKRLFLSNTTRMLALDITEKEFATSCPEVLEICQFIRKAKRGVCPAYVGPSTDDHEE